LRWLLLLGLAVLSLWLLLHSLPGLAQSSFGTRLKPPVAVAANPYVPHVPPRAIAYQRSSYVLGLLGLFWHLLGLWILLPTGLSVRVRSFLYRRLRLPETTACPPPFRIVAAYLLFYALFLLCWMLPFRMAGVLLEAHFGFSRENLGDFIGDMARDTLFGLVVIPLYWGGYWLYARSPRRWWQILWAILIPLLFIQFVLSPVLIAPAYNHFTPLSPGPLRTKILALAGRAGITGARVFVEDTSRRTTHVNAYVTGIGPTTRIVLNDTALQSLPEKELLGMLAHEMGHYVEGHSWVNFAANVVGSGIFFWLASRLLPWEIRRWGDRWRLHGICDIAALPVILLTIRLFLLVQDPLSNTLSRTLEHRADAFALRLTGDGDSLARLFVRFAEIDYSDPNPPAILQFWFGTHPTLSQRIAFALHYRAAATSIPKR